MGEQVLRYDRMVEGALRGVVRQALTVAEKEGLPGGHHFYLTFETRAPNVEIPQFLLEKYPDQMTIVIQYQYENLLVSEEAFEIDLHFSGRRCRLRIPFAALTAFVDPSVKFGLQFKLEGATGTGQSAAEPTAADTPAAAEEQEKSAEVVTLDSFRKKQ